MRLTKKYLIIGALLLSAALAGSACGKKNDSNQTQSTKTSEVSESRGESTSAEKNDSNKVEMKMPINLGNLGDIDLEANATNLGDFAGTADLYFSDRMEEKGHRCFFNSYEIPKESAENIYKVGFVEKLEEVPEKIKKIELIWEYFVSDEDIYYMGSEQDFEIITDKSEKVTYNEADFIREEGHIEIRPKDPSNTYYPELVTIKYIAFYYKYEPDGINTIYGDGMGMAIWGTALGEAAEERLNDYNLIKETADKSMATLQTTNRLGQYN